MLHHLPQRLTIVLGLCGLLFATVPGAWLDVPFIKQEKDGCGSATIAMVMQYWLKQKNRPLDSAADPAVIQRALYSSKEHGIRAADMERYFQEHGFKTFAFAGKWDDFQQHLGKGRPLIVALKPSGLATARHYVVVVGIDSERDLVLLNDAAQRKLLKQDRGSFENQWNAVGRWTLLALPKG